MWHLRLSVHHYFWNVDVKLLLEASANGLAFFLMFLCTLVEIPTVIRQTRLKSHIPPVILNTFFFFFDKGPAEPLLLACHSRLQSRNLNLLPDGHSFICFLQCDSTPHSFKMKSHNQPALVGQGVVSADTMQFGQRGTFPAIRRMHAPPGTMRN